ncbi:MAG TPA: radical SAM protein [Terriglobales bacterium]|nr:radical SAM protein [Terriglobales bacterium]
MTIAPQRGIVYGPVRSRRLGRSLGINLLPAGRKVCTFDCVYCQYGWSDAGALASMRPDEWPRVEEVLGAVEAALVRLAEDPPAYLTFSGNGEPTLHPRFGEILTGVKELRDRLAPRARTAVLSNSSRVGDASVRKALAALDRRIMKLDAGTEEGFRRVSRPLDGLTLADVVAGLSALEEVTIQTLLIAGPDGNLEPGEIEAWLARIAAIRPSVVQLYTLDRGAPSDRIEAAGEEQLESAAERLKKAGVAARVF